MFFFVNLLKNLIGFRKLNQKELHSNKELTAFWISSLPLFSAACAISNETIFLKNKICL